MSSSAIINRREVLELLDQLETAVGSPAEHTPETGEHSDDPQVRDAAQQAAALVEAAQAERGRMLEQSEIVRAARELSAKLRSEAEQESAELRTDTDEYVDGRLASLEISLTKTLEAVTRGRERLHGRSHFASLAPGEQQEDEAGNGNLGSAEHSR
jgi:cell division septum initiation protein DivIVA